MLYLSVISVLKMKRALVLGASALIILALNQKTVTDVKDVSHYVKIQLSKLRSRPDISPCLSSSMFTS